MKLREDWRLFHVCTSTFCRDTDTRRFEVSESRAEATGDGARSNIVVRSRLSDLTPSRLESNDALDSNAVAHDNVSGPQFRFVVRRYLFVEKRHSDAQQIAFER